MKIFDRYFLRQVVLIHLGSLLVIGSIFTLVTLGVTCQQNIPLIVALKALPLTAPQTLSVTMPLASVVAVFLAYGSMRENREFMALKALGTPVWRVFVPGWIYFFIMSLLCVWFNNLEISWAREQIQRVFIAEFKNTILSQLRAVKSFSTPDDSYIIDVSDVTESGILLNPVFTAKKEGVTGVAETANIEVDASGSEPIVYLSLYKLEASSDEGMAVFPESVNFPIPLSGFIKSSRVDPSLSQVGDALAQLERDRESYHQKLATGSIFAFLSGNLLSTVDERWQRRSREEWYFDKRQSVYELVPPRVWASGFACFFMPWVCAPLTTYTPRKGNYILIMFFGLLCTVPLYYTLYEIALSNAKSGALPPCSIWLANIVFGLAGSYLLTRVKYFT